MVDGNSCTALLDTGSTVSTISEKFYSDNLSECEIYPLTNLLNIECDDGESLPYKGYVETSLVLQGLSDSPRFCLFLILPDSTYNNGTSVVGNKCFNSCPR